jgi:ribosome biogenesis GTPase / thiamine phosphate phosphatase
MNHDLSALGWNARLAAHFDELHDEPGGDNALPGRIAREDRGRYLVLSERGEQTATLAGRYRHTALGRGELPTVGDWVVLRLSAEGGVASIQALLPRASRISRKAVMGGGRTEEQVLAANTDTIFIVAGLDRDFNTRRIERYLAVAWDSGASPVVLLNKTDLCEDIEAARGALGPIGAAVPVLALSATRGEGVAALRPYLGPGRTVVFLGSSGVGKSTIINTLLGDARQEVRETREYDDRGRHTTTARELILLPGGGVLIDTPGMRELQPWDDEGGLQRVFDDVEAIATDCRFRNCTHDGEPGCAVREAIDAGRLDPRRVQNYLRMMREQAILAVRKDQRSRIAVWDRPKLSRQMQARKGWTPRPPRSR